MDAILDREPVEDITHKCRDVAKLRHAGSRVQEWNLLHENVRVTSFRTRHEQFEDYFRMEDDLVFCSDVEGLMNALGMTIKNGDYS